MAASIGLAVDLARARQRVLVRHAAQRHELLDAHREGTRAWPGTTAMRRRQRLPIEFVARHAVDRSGRCRFAGPAVSAGMTAQQRRFACAVGTQQRHQLAGAHAGGDVASARRAP